MPRTPDTPRPSIARDHVRLGGAIATPSPNRSPADRHDLPEHVAAWEAHVAAGRIGTRVAPDPAIAENRARTETILRGARRG